VGRLLGWVFKGISRNRRWEGWALEGVLEGVLEVLGGIGVGISQE
jgi:hypothetical protein